MGRSCRTRFHRSNDIDKPGDPGPLRKRSDFNRALSTLNRLHRESGGQQLRPMPYWKYQKRQPSLSSTPLGGNGVDPGGLPKNSKKVNEKEGMQRFITERGNPLSTDLWVKPQTNGFHEFILFFSVLLQINRLQLMSVNCNRREVYGQHLKRPFFAV